MERKKKYTQKQWIETDRKKGKKQWDGKICKKMNMCVEDKTVKWKQPHDKIEADEKVCISLFMVIYPTSSRLEFMESNAIPFNKPQVFDQI